MWLDMFTRADGIFVAILGITVSMEVADATIASLHKWITTSSSASPREGPLPQPRSPGTVARSAETGSVKQEARLAETTDQFDPLFRDILERQLEVEKLNNPSTFVEYAKASRALSKLQKEWEDKFATMAPADRQRYIPAMKARNMDMSGIPMIELAGREPSSPLLDSAGSPFASMFRLASGGSADISLRRLMGFLGAAGGSSESSNTLNLAALLSQTGSTNSGSINLLKFLKNPIRLLCGYLAVHYISGSNFRMAISRLPILSLPRSFFWPLSIRGFPKGFPLSMITRDIEQAVVQQLTLGIHEAEGFSETAFSLAPAACREYLTFGLLASIAIVSLAIAHFADELRKSKKFLLDVWEQKCESGVGRQMRDKKQN